MLNYNTFESYKSTFFCKGLYSSVNDTLKGFAFSLKFLILLTSLQGILWCVCVGVGMRACAFACVCRCIHLWVQFLEHEIFHYLSIIRDYIKEKLLL